MGEKMRIKNKVGLGTFPFANPFTPIESAEIEKIIRTYIKGGGQYIDTAPTYADGNVEQTLGRILKGFGRDEYFISSMCGYVRQPDGKYSVSGKFEDVLIDCDKSLERLGVEYLDLYMSHIPDPSTPFSETMRALVNLKQQGKIKHIGVANVNSAQLLEYNLNGDIEIVQNRSSFINRAISQDLLDYCQTNNIGLIFYQAIERGLLTNKIAEGFTLREGDLRNKKPEFKEEIRNEIGQWVKTYLIPIASANNVSVSTLVIWWAMQQQQVSAVLFGAISKDQLEINLKAIRLELGKKDKEMLEDSYDALREILMKNHGLTIRQYMGLADYDMYKSGSPSGR
jgi:aryl-alcohol dehydrogenase-like predicted oxidoreductase